MNEELEQLMSSIGIGFIEEIFKGKYLIFDVNSAITVINEMKRFDVTILGFNCWTRIDEKYELYNIAYGVEWFFLDWSSDNVDKVYHWNVAITKIKEAESYAKKDNRSIFFQLIYEEPIP